tara:strand:- start:534 stop:1814 length:1281 start_codon:yes stop_codon:yes gene_type:complete
MKQSSDKGNDYQENTIILRALVFSLIERKFLILGLTAFITILTALYSLTFATTYQLTSSFQQAPKSSITNINKLFYINESKESLFTSFLINLTSQDFQKKVFVENGFLTVFNKNNKEIDNVDNFISSNIDVSLNMPKLTMDDKEIYLYERPYSISMNGTDKEAITEFLNELVSQANSKTITELSKENQKKISIRLNQIHIEKERFLNNAKQSRLNLIARIMEEDNQKIREIKDQITRAKYKANQTRLIKIAELYDFAKIAKSLGIIENNFKLFDGNYTNSDLTIAVGENLDLPEWYFYGEKALLETIALLEGRTSDDPFISEVVTLNNHLSKVKNNNLLKTLATRQDDSPFIPELIELNLEKIALESTTLTLSNANSVHVVESAKVKNTSRSKRLVVFQALIVSFMMSILLALVMIVLKPNEGTPA